MDRFLAKKYYSRPDVQQAILDFAKDREIGVMFNGFFGKRPDVIEYISDVKALVNKGVFSFHSSEERWANPLLLGNDKLSDEEKTKNRIGWDMIFDLDGVDFEYSRIVAQIIMDFLDSVGVMNKSIKFSGNKGFHIGIPFEAFSSEIIGIGETRELFPDAARKIAAYIVYEIKGDISRKILEKDGPIENVAKKYDIPLADLIVDDPKALNFNFMKVIEVDTILISSRHLFRMPYSLNEKSGLVSVPLPNDKIGEFSKSWAKPDNVKPDWNKKFEFLRYDQQYGKDGNKLLEEAYYEDHLDAISKDVVFNLGSGKKYVGSDQTFEITEEVDIKDFPPTISYVLNNNFDDGKKRALFLLLTFLTSIKWSFENIETLIFEWNDIQESPLKKNYIVAQFSWFKNQQKILSPPNYDNDNYFKGIGIPAEVIESDKKKFKGIDVKNPLHYLFLLTNKKSKGKKKE